MQRGHQERHSRTSRRAAREMACRRWSVTAATRAGGGLSCARRAVDGRSAAAPPVQWPRSVAALRLGLRALGPHSQAQQSGPHARIEAVRVGPIQLTQLVQAMAPAVGVHSARVAEHAAAVSAANVGREGALVSHEGPRVSPGSAQGHERRPLQGRTSSRPSRPPRAPADPAGPAAWPWAACSWGPPAGMSCRSQDHYLLRRPEYPSPGDRVCGLQNDAAMRRRPSFTNSSCSSTPPA